MSLEFLSAEQRAGFGRFTGLPSSAELDRCCVLSDTDVERVRRRRRSQNRLGFAVQLVTVRLVGRFLPTRWRCRGRSCSGWPGSWRLMIRRV
jgi:Transposase.